MVHGVQRCGPHARMAVVCNNYYKIGNAKEEGRGGRVTILASLEDCERHVPQERMQNRAFPQMHSSYLQDPFTL